MTEKFQWMQERYNELSEAVSQPEIIADMARWQRLLKEHAQLEPAVQAWQRYQQLLTQQTEAEEMLNDPELASMAQTELHELTHRRADMEQELRLLLCRRILTMSATWSWKFVQVRAARRPACLARIFCACIPAMPSGTGIAWKWCRSTKRSWAA